MKTSCPVCEETLVDWKELDLRHCNYCGYSSSTREFKNPYKFDPKLTEKFSLLDDSPESRGLSALRISLLKPYQRKGSRLCDVGASVGTFVSQASHQGWRSEGIEISPWAIEEAQRKTRPIFQGNAEDLNGRLRDLHAVTAFDLIEHLKNPFSFIQRVHEALKENGVFMLSTPDAGGIDRGNFHEWRHYKPEQHYHYFTRESISSILEDLGFNVVLKTNLESLIRFNPEKIHHNILTLVSLKR